MEGRLRLRRSCKTVESGMMEGGADIRRPAACAVGKTSRLVRALLALSRSAVQRCRSERACGRSSASSALPDEQQIHSPKPCEQVDLAGGYAVLKDIVGDTQFLLMPTARITGIESPEILAPDAPNYWEAAWQARHFVDERAHRDLPRDAISLAINSDRGRTQNQLHIHMDCVRLDVQAALRDARRRHRHALGAIPSRAGRPRLHGDAHRPAGPRAQQSVRSARRRHPRRARRHGALHAGRGRRADGFVLLAGRAAGIANRGSGEELQDHACAAAH